MLGIYSETSSKSNKLYFGNSIVNKRESVVTPDSHISPIIVSSFAEGEDRVNRNNNNFFKSKYSGDQNDAINNSSTAINYRNEFIVRSVRNFDRDNKDTINNNTGNIFINPLIGNGNVINSVDSSKNQEHYFSNAKKHIRLQAKGILSGSDQDQFVLTGSDTLSVNAFIYDDNNVSYRDSNWSSIFGSSILQPISTTNSTISFRVSGSNTSFNVSDLVVALYFDAVSFDFYLDRTPIVIDEGDGWNLCTYSFLGDKSSVFFYPESNDFWPINSSFFGLEVFTVGKIYVFKDIKFDFDQSLTDDGVEYFKKLDNQNTDKLLDNINEQVNRNIDSSITNINFIQHYPLFERSRAFMDYEDDSTFLATYLLASDFKNQIFYTSGVTSTDCGIKSISINNPTAWTRVDTFVGFGGTSFGSGVYFIKVNPYDNSVYYGGRQDPDIGFLRKSSTGKLGSFETVERRGRFCKIS